MLVFGDSFAMHLVPGFYHLIRNQK
ncbi:hypothetical protein BCU61_024505 [Vibrio splendidus]